MSFRDLRGLARFPSQQALVLRDSEKKVIPAEQLVVGDIVEIKGGDQIPADIRLLFTQGCKVSVTGTPGSARHSRVFLGLAIPGRGARRLALNCLTTPSRWTTRRSPGSPSPSLAPLSAPTTASWRPRTSASTPPPAWKVSPAASASASRAWTGPSPLPAAASRSQAPAPPAGTATGLVISTGDHTVIGQIASLASGVGNEKTPIAVEIEHFVHIVAGVAISVGVMFFIIAVSMKYQVLDSIIFLIGIIVANVPEGLLATVTVSPCHAAARPRPRQCSL